MQRAYSIGFASKVLRCAALVGIFVCGARAYAATDDHILLDVEVQGPEVTLDVDFIVQAMPQEIWAVLTDYDHAAEFISGLERSVILSGTQDTLLVSQKGSMGFGPFSVTFETITEVQLTPYKTIRTRMVSGNMKKNQSTTLISQEATGTRVVHHLESIPDVWIPPIIGRIFIAHEAHIRFRQLVAEILRRNAARALIPREPAD